MRKFVTVASIVVLAASAASCGNSQPGSNSAGNILPLDSPIGPSALEARSGQGGGGKGGGKGGGGTTSGGGGSLSVVMVVDSNSNGAPNWNDTITFNVSTTATTEPHVTLSCYQNGFQVLSTSAGFFDGYPWPASKNMRLSTSSWPSGAANCTAKLIYFSGSSDVVLATLNFTAAA